MHSRSSVLPLHSSVRQAPEIPLASVLAFASRRVEPIVTIGKWRVVFIPDDPCSPFKGHPGTSHVATQQGVHGDPRERDSRWGREQREPSGLVLPVQDPSGDVGRDPAMPDGVVWIDVDKSAAHEVVSLLQRQSPNPEQALSRGNPIPGLDARVQGLGRRIRQASPSHAVELGPFGSVSLSALSWALLSQVFWVPLLAIDVHDRWVARQRDITPPGQPLPSSPIARATAFDFSNLLGAARPLQPLRGQANPAARGAVGQALPGTSSGGSVLLSRAGSSASSLLDRPFTASVDTPASPSSGAGQAAAGRPQVAPLERLGTLGRAFTRAQLLGGSVSLADLQEGPMAPLALVERALQRSSSDPLAPLPPLWREPMRQALRKLPGTPRQLDTARTVYVPSRSVSQPVEVPLALQSDGSVDILEVPANPALLREINSWSRQQRPPASGSVVPAIVHLHPLPQEAPIAPRSAVAVGTNRVQAPASVPASLAVPAPITSETAAPAATAAPIPVPIVSEAPAAAPSAAAAGEPGAPLP